MSLNKAAAAAVKKKLTLLDESFARFAVRSTLAGVYLAIGTAFAGVVGMGVEKHAAGLGPLVFAALFGLGLFAIVILGAELATSNMMYMVYGAVKKHVGWGKALWLLVVTTLFNLIGVVLFAAAMSVSAKLGNMDPSHLIATMSAAKLEKSPGGLLVEAMAANFVVNMAIIGAISAKELLSKFFVIVPIIACFVGLSLEHVIANFCLMLLTAFCASPLPDAFSIGAVLTNWSIAWIGNLIGGGFLMGGVYAWLNSGPEAYRD